MSARNQTTGGWKETANLEPSAETKHASFRCTRPWGKGTTLPSDALISRAAQALVVGTDPAEWFVGHSEITETLKAQMEEMGGGFPFQAGTFRPIAKVASAGLRTRRP